MRETEGSWETGGNGRDRIPRRRSGRGLEGRKGPVTAYIQDSPDASSSRWRGGRGDSGGM